jgi:hypothetical protein
MRIIGHASRKHWKMLKEIIGNNLEEIVCRQMSLLSPHIL